MVSIVLDARAPRTRSGDRRKKPPSGRIDGTSAMSGPRSILRVVQVFSELGTHPQGQSLAQLCQTLSMPKTTLFTMLRVLESAGYVTQVDGTYRLGREAASLGAVMAQDPTSNFPECANGVLQRLVQRTGETGFLAVLTGDRMACEYVSVVESDNWLRYIVQLGSHKPAFATGTGRAMLAYLPADELDSVLGRFRFERITTKTVPSRRALLAGLKEVRRGGMSVVDSGTVAGATSVAAPIFGANGQVMAAVSVGGPSTRIDARLDAVQEAVRDAAEKISLMLGYRGEWPESASKRAGKHG
jgi:DNA-binding IclR family transcriptional regulator